MRVSFPARCRFDRRFQFWSIGWQWTYARLTGGAVWTLSRSLSWRVWLATSVMNFPNVQGCCSGSLESRQSRLSEMLAAALAVIVNILDTRYSTCDIAIRFDA